MSNIASSPADVTQEGAAIARVQTNYKRVVVACTVATALEWYDFFVYAVVAPLAFDTVFFPKLDPLVGTIAVWSSFAIGFAARPLGGMFFGHFGDKIGRRAAVFQTIVLMGICSTLIGVLPSYATIGIWAPILLVILRFLQGFALGGESIGAALLAVEAAPEGKRGFYGAFPQASGPLGIITASAVMVPISYWVGQSGIAEWGWRAPFLFTVVPMAVALALLASISESLVFLHAKAEAKVTKTPVLDVFRYYKKPWLIATAIAMGSSAFSYIVSIFAMAYGARTLGISPGTMSTAFFTGNVLALFSMPYFGHLSDRIGRRPMWGIGMAISVLYLPFFFMIIATKEPVLVIAAITIGAGVVHPLMFGAEGSFLPELFDTKVRFSGASLGKQIGVLLGGGMAPLIATTLLAWSGGAFWSVDVYYLAVGIIGLVALWLASETRHRKL